MNEYFIYWSPLAEETYLKIIEYILENWTVKEAEEFENKVERIVEKLKTYKGLCPPSEKRKTLRRCVITPQTSLVYRVKDNTIELISFFDNRSNHQYF